MSQPLLEIRNLSLERGERLLFERFSMALHGGEIVRLAGANGAGKTSLMRTLAGLLLPQNADFIWRGQPLDNAQMYSDEVLYLGHKPAVRFQLTPLENLRWYAHLQAQQVGAADDTDLMAALASLGLAGYEHEPCLQLSAGQKRRVGLARMAISTAPLWILDEPFTAVDVSGVATLCDWMGAFADRGGTVLFTTHQQVDFAGHSARVVDLDNLATEAS